ncbi:MAG: hypothetical protein V5788_12505 [Shewanella sp.]
MQRMRNISPKQLVLAMLNTLGTKTNINFAGIHKNLCSEHNIGMIYKPFHNKLKKTELTQLLRTLTEQTANQWLLGLVHQVLPSEYPFKSIEAYDGSSLKLHIGLTKEVSRPIHQGSPSSHRVTSSHKCSDMLDAIN